MKKLYSCMHSNFFWTLSLWAKFCHIICSTVRKNKIIWHIIIYLPVHVISLMFYWFDQKEWIHTSFIVFFFFCDVIFNSDANTSICMCALSTVENKREMKKKLLRRMFHAKKTQKYSSSYFRVLRTSQTYFIF